MIHPALYSFHRLVQPEALAQMPEHQQATAALLLVALAALAERQALHQAAARSAFL